MRCDRRCRIRPDPGYLRRSGGPDRRFDAADSTKFERTFRLLPYPSPQWRPVRVRRAGASISETVQISSGIVPERATRPYGIIRLRRRIARPPGARPPPVPAAAGRNASRRRVPPASETAPATCRSGTPRRCKPASTGSPELPQLPAHARGEHREFLRGVVHDLLRDRVAFGCRCVDQRSERRHARPRPLRPVKTMQHVVGIPRLSGPIRISRNRVGGPQPSSIRSAARSAWRAISNAPPSSPKM